MIGNKRRRACVTRYTLHATRSGFTLVEVLVALSLFAVVVTIATDLFLSFQRTSRKTQNLELVVTNARLVTERIASQLREGTIEYDLYGPGVNLSQAQTGLYTRSNTGTESYIYLADDSDVGGNVCPDLQSHPCMALRVGNATESLTGTGVRVRVVEFRIVPDQDPFEFVSGTGAFRANIQPRVTMYLSFENTKNPLDPNYARYDVQTTISSRIYRR